MTEATGWSLVPAAPGEPFTFPDIPEVHERYQAATDTIKRVQRTEP